MGPLGKPSSVWFSLWFRVQGVGSLGLLAEVPGPRLPFRVAPNIELKKSYARGSRLHGILRTSTL